MKKLLINCLLFLALWIVLNILVFLILGKPVLYSKYISSPAHLSKYHKYLLADSHGNALNQEDLDKLGICNFSYDSDSYFDLLVKTNYLVNNFSPDTIFLSCDDHTLSKYREHWTNRHRSIYFANYKLYHKYYRTSFPDFIYKKYIKFYLPLMDTKNSKIFNAYLKTTFTNNKAFDYRSFNFNTLDIETQQRRSQERIETQYPNEESSAQMAKCVEEIIATCASKNIVVIGIKFPLSAPFLEALETKNFGADQLLLNNGCKVLDFKTRLAYDTSLFRDQDHVNNLGSKQFQQLFANEMVLVQNKPSEPSSGAIENQSNLSK